MVENKSIPVHRGNSAATSPDGRLIAIGTNGSRKYPVVHTFLIREAKTGEEIYKIGDFTPSSPVFTPDGNWLIFGSNVHLTRDNKGMNTYVIPTKVFDLATGKVVSEVDAPMFHRLTTDGHWIASANYDVTVSLWDILALSQGQKSE